MYAETEAETETETEKNLTDWTYRWGLSFYELGISAFFACGGLAWLKRKYKVGVGERMGRIGPDVPKNALWVHAVSVGEVQSALALFDVARKGPGARPGPLPRLLSTVTVTGRAVAEKLAPRPTAMIYSPWDVPRFVNRALDALAPKAYVAMETERWPVMLAALRARKIPAFLVNGRLSDRSARRLQGQRAFWRGVLCCFERLMVRFESDKEQFLMLGVPEWKIIVTGDCKVDAMLVRRAGTDAGKWRFLRRAGGPLFLAGSTHAGEDEIVLSAFEMVRRAHPGARLLIAPRHPERALSIAAEIAARHGKAVLFSRLTNECGHEREREWDVAVVDRIGVLFELYAAADAAFVGGSLVPKGGQNLMEPALFGIQAAHGPDMADFPDAPRMDALGASREVRDAESLAEAWLRSLDREERKRTREACETCFASVAGAASRSWSVIESYLSDVHSRKAGGE
ncbi:MAG: 3-deoxy-D-manno-octulosonic acid transferase [Synergistaceae bacterium]|jgi:3-deoxy-D-manno-octulosonic-acid transferase|nr:3-deoxy-D-manno-octulosonic acid transferase [Synergistaceae bacterium]